MAQVRALDQSGYIGDDEAAEIVKLHHAKLRLECRERIIGDLRARRGKPRDERGFSGVGESDQTHVGQQLQLQPQPALFTRTARLVLGRRLVRGSRETGIASAAPATMCDQESLARSGEVVQLFSRFRVVYHG